MFVESKSHLVIGLMNGVARHECIIGIVNKNNSSNNDNNNYIIYNDDKYCIYVYQLTLLYTEGL